MEDTNKEQQTAALNTLINLALQVSNAQQARIQESVNILAKGLGLDEGKPPAGDPADHVEKDQFRSDAEADADALASAGQGTDEDYGGSDKKM